MPKRQKGPRVSGQPQSQRQLRVGEVVRKALVESLARGVIYDPIIEDAKPTISEVRASPDLKRASVYVSPLGGGDPTALLKALNNRGGLLRAEVSRKVNLRVTPALSFVADESFDRASNLNNLIHSPDVARDLTLDDTLGDED
ncbi:MAG: 30S ribosome-binding factor RbfA [Alphaproteobacteria bacterium]